MSNKPSWHRKAFRLAAEIMSHRGSKFEQLKDYLDEQTAMHFDTINFMIRALYLVDMLTMKEADRALQRMSNDINDALEEAARRREVAR